MRVAINGFGRIGRVLTRVLQDREGIELIAINDVADIEVLGHLLKYDSVHRAFPGTVQVMSGVLEINSKEVQILNERNPAKLPWGDLDIDIVIECTGFFREKNQAQLHLDAGAKRVIISAPPLSGGIKTIVMGINEDILTAEDKIISNASCTTNSAAPMIKILDELCTIDSGYITTIHSYTTDQRLHDAPHQDLRRARAAATSIVPTSTGAAKAITKIFPHLENRIGGCGIRVPVPNGSLTDISAVVQRPVDASALNRAFEQSAAANMHGIVEYIEDPIVSVDVIGNPHSCVFDSQLTSVVGKMVKLVGWYDNETGYSNRLADLIHYCWNLDKS